MSEYLLEKAKTCYHCKPLVDENEILSRKLAALEAENERLREALINYRASVSGGEKLCGHKFTCICAGDLVAEVLGEKSFSDRAAKAMRGEKP